MLSSDRVTQGRYGLGGLWGSIEIVKAMGQGALLLTNEHLEMVRDFSKVYHHLQEIEYRWDDAVVMRRAMYFSDDNSYEDAELLRMFSAETVWKMILGYWDVEGLFDFVEHLVTRSIFTVNDFPMTVSDKIRLIREAPKDVAYDKTHWIQQLF